MWNNLLAGAPAAWLLQDGDTLNILGVAEWDGHRWDTLANRLQPPSSSQNVCGAVNSFLRYEGQLYANGPFALQTETGYTFDFARWSEENSRWEGLECTFWSTTSIATAPMEPPQQTMYFTGYMDTLCSYPASCVFAYDGSAFSPSEPFEAWTGTDEDYVGFVFEYQDQFYMTAC